MTAQTELERLIVSVGNSLRSAWESGYATGVQEMVSLALGQIEQRVNQYGEPNYDQIVAILRNLKELA